MSSFSVVDIILLCGLIVNGIYRIVNSIDLYCILNKLPDPKHACLYPGLDNMI